MKPFILRQEQLTWISQNTGCSATKL